MRLSRNNGSADARDTRETRAAMARLREHLSGRGLRLTAEREALARAISAQSGHFDIEELAARLRAAGVEASRATVYRALPLLVEAGIVERTVEGGRGARYERAVGREHHDHLVCERCARVVEFRFEAFAMLEREVAARHGFTLTSHRHELFGVCAECRAAAPGANGHSENPSQVDAASRGVRRGVRR